MADKFSWIFLERAHAYHLLISFTDRFMAWQWALDVENPLAQQRAWKKRHNCRWTVHFLTSSSNTPLEKKQNTWDLQTMLQSSYVGHKYRRCKGNEEHWYRCNNFFSHFVLFSGQESMLAESQASTMNLRAVLETKVILYPICIY